MPETKPNLLIPAVGATVLVCGTVAAFMYFKSPSRESLSALASAELVPATAVMTTYMRTDAPAWAKLQEFGTPEAQEIVKQGLENVSQSLLSAGDISYREDLKPWVGSVMLAVLPASANQVIQSNQPDSGNLQNSQPQMFISQTMPK